MFVVTVVNVIRKMLIIIISIVIIIVIITITTAIIIILNHYGICERERETRKGKETRFLVLSSKHDVEILDVNLRRNRMRLSPSWSHGQCLLREGCEKAIVCRESVQEQKEDG